MTFQPAPNARVYETTIFSPAPGKLEELEALIKKNQPATASFPGVLEWQWFTTKPEGIVKPPGGHGGPGPVFFPQIIGWFIFKDQATHNAYLNTPFVQAFFAQAEKDKLFSKPSEQFLTTPFSGFEKKGSQDDL